MKTIFIGIASYRDTELTKTITSAIDNATSPDRLVFGVCRQYSSEEKGADSLEPIRDKCLIRTIEVNASESKGLGWAREKVIRLFAGEDYYLQLDAHSRFAKGWDDDLIDMAIMTKSDYPIITGYANPYNPETEERDEGKPVMAAIKFTDAGTIAFGAKETSYIQDTPVRARFASGHFFFTVGIWARKYTFNPELFFKGEEIRMAVYSYTLGFDLFHPHKNVIWHKYYDRTDVVKKPSKPHDDKGLDQLMWVLAGTDEDHMHGPNQNNRLGDVRTLKEYEEYAGVNFKEKTISDAANNGEEPALAVIPKYTPQDLSSPIFNIPESAKMIVMDPVTLEFKPFMKTNKKEADEIAGRAMSQPLRSPKLNDQPKAISCLSILTTYGCNLSCDYCYISDDNDQKGCMKPMTWEMAKKAIDDRFPVGDKAPPVHLSFIGGEPVMNMDLIIQAALYTKENYDTVHLSLITNGLLLNRPLKSIVRDKSLIPEDMKDGTVATFMDEYKIAPQLSMQGSREEQDKFRRYNNGKSSYDDWMENIQHIKDNYPDLSKLLSLRLTMGEYSEDGIQLVDILKNMNDLCRDGYASSVHVEGAMYEIESKLETEKEKLALVREIYRQHMVAAKWCVLEIEAGRSVSWVEVINHVVVPVLSKHPRTKFCGAGKELVAIDPEGKYLACHRPVTGDIGTIKDGLDPAKTAEWMDARVLSMKECRSCALRGVCGGGCRALNYLATGELMEPYWLQCAFVQIRFLAGLFLTDRVGYAFNKSNNRR